jgi:hypothetical protein
MTLEEKLAAIEEAGRLSRELLDDGSIDLREALEIMNDAAN